MLRQARAACCCLCYEKLLFFGTWRYSQERQGFISEDGRLHLIPCLPPAPKVMIVRPEFMSMAI